MENIATIIFLVIQTLLNFFLIHQTFKFCTSKDKNVLILIWQIAIVVIVGFSLFAPKTATFVLPSYSVEYSKKVEDGSNNDIIINKLKVKNGELKPVKGATFKLLDEDGNLIENDGKSFITDENGNITITNLKPGKYMIREGFNLLELTKTLTSIIFVCLKILFIFNLYNLSLYFLEKIKSKFKNHIENKFTKN